jgi:hypothetical protein
MINLDMVNKKSQYQILEKARLERKFKFLNLLVKLFAVCPDRLGR